MLLYRIYDCLIASQRLRLLLLICTSATFGCSSRNDTGFGKREQHFLNLHAHYHKRSSCTNLLSYHSNILNHGNRCDRPNFAQARYGEQSEFGAIVRWNSQNLMVLSGWRTPHPSRRGRQGQRAWHVAVPSAQRDEGWRTNVCHAWNVSAALFWNVLGCSWRGTDTRIRQLSMHTGRQIISRTWEGQWRRRICLLGQWKYWSQRRWAGMLVNYEYAQVTRRKHDNKDNSS